MNQDLLDSKKLLCSYMRTLGGQFIKENVGRIFKLIDSFLENELTSVKETQKKYSKLRDKYDSCLIRYVNVSKSRDADEELQSLTESRAEFLTASFTYACKIKEFQLQSHVFVAELFALELSAKVNLYFESSDGLKGISVILDDSLKELKAVKFFKINFKIQADYDDHSKSLNISKIQAAQKDSSHDDVEMEGYLFKRISPAIGQISWQKRYFRLKGGRLSYSFQLQSARKKGAVGEIESVHVLLCNFRLYHSDDRRFCFQIINPLKSWVLQGFFTKANLSSRNTRGAIEVDGCIRSIQNQSFSF
jgi:hypothetical protein